MQFSSSVFGLFLSAVFLLYWALPQKTPRGQNILLLIASNVFYGWWNWRLCLLLFGVTLINYLTGSAISRTTESRRKRYLVLGVTLNLSCLSLFKYFGFFADSLTSLCAALGWNIDLQTLRIVLPVGISFYMFQSMTYPLDIYRRQLNHNSDFFSFFTFASFFPQLLAGPIERARNMIPQFGRPRAFDLEMAKDGLRQMLWGFFKKLVIADTVSVTVDRVFSNYSTYYGIELFVIAIAYAIQIYCDFSGYSDIAIGTAKLFGIKVMRNFATPYFSRDIAEFWRRWHISLSSILRDYVYTPISWKVSLANKPRQILNVLIVFTICGVWHGASWNYVVWGFLNGLFFIPLILRRSGEERTRIVAQNKLLPTLNEALAMFTTFAATTFAWVIFRAESLQDAGSFLQHMFTGRWLVAPHFKYVFILGAFLFSVEWIQRGKPYALDIRGFNRTTRWCIYASTVVAILAFGNFGISPFLYMGF